MLAPIQITATRSLRRSPEEIGQELLRLENWKNFNGYGPLPGIREARFRHRTPEVVGTQIEVTNRDGSSHVEEIVEWLHTGSIVIRMSGFSAPLSRFATHFIERWTFSAEGGAQRVCRSLALHPSGWAGGVFLRLIGPLMRRALDRHLQELGAV